MSPRLLIILVVFLVAQGLLTFGRAAFRQAVAAANEKLPAAEAIDAPRALLQWRAVRRKLRAFEESSKALTRSDLLNVAATVILLGLGIYVIATWGTA